MASDMGFQFKMAVLTVTEQTFPGKVILYLRLGYSLCDLAYSKGGADRLMTFRVLLGSFF